MPALPPPAPKTLPNRVPIGATVDPSNAAALFRPLNMRGCVLKNRVVVSPMCQCASFYAFMGPIMTINVD